MAPILLFGPDFIRADAGGAVAYTLTCQTGAFTLTGPSVTLTWQGQVTDSGGGSLLLLGLQFIRAGAGGGTAYTLTCQTGAFTLTGQPVTLTWSGSTAYTLTCQTGAFLVNGSPVTLTWVQPTPPPPGPGIRGGPGGRIPYLEYRRHRRMGR